MSEPLREELPTEELVPEGETETLPMAWHGFLTRFLLWLLPICTAFQTVWILTGRVYYSAEIRDRIYAGICGMGALDRGLSLLLLAVAVLVLAARRRLVQKRRSGVALLLSGLGLAALAWALYGILRFALAGLSPLSPALIGQCAVYLILLLVNARYYARRKDILVAENVGERSQK